jgi:hypothetical protein
VVPLGLITDHSLFQIEAALVAIFGGAALLAWLMRRLSDTRPDFSIMKPIAVGFGLRIMAVLSIGQLTIARNLRGGDELGFLGHGQYASHFPITSPQSTDLLTSELHSFLISLNFRVFGSAPDVMLRTEMITLSVAGIVFLSAAVYELAGARPAKIAAWLLALEPTNIFFSSLIHKEPLMYMAEGLVAFGGAIVWKRGKLSGLVPTVIGCLIALATRPYVGWFLTAAAALVFLHAGLTRLHGMRSLAMIVGTAAVIGALVVPVFIQKSSQKALAVVQTSQDANARDTKANLSLERVDYSTRQKIVLNLPKRVADVITRPYLWQTQNASQQLGVIGTLVVLASLFLLIRALAHNRSAVMRRAGPLVYPGLLMLFAYALSAGNAGTAFRYRTHIMAMALALIVVLREHARQEKEVMQPADLPRWKNAGATPTLAQ